MKTKDIVVGEEYEVGRWHRAKVVGLRERRYKGDQNTVEVQYLDLRTGEPGTSGRVYFTTPRSITRLWADRVADQAREQAYRARQQEIRNAKINELLIVASEANNAIDFDAFFVSGQDTTYGEPRIMVKTPETLARLFILRAGTDA